MSRLLCGMGDLWDDVFGPGEDPGESAPGPNMAQGVVGGGGGNAAVPPDEAGPRGKRGPKGPWGKKTLEKIKSTPPAELLQRTGRGRPTKNDQILRGCFKGPATPAASKDPAPAPPLEDKGGDGGHGDQQQPPAPAAPQRPELAPGGARPNRPHVWPPDPLLRKYKFLECFVTGEAQTAKVPTPIEGEVGKQAQQSTQDMFTGHLKSQTVMSEIAGSSRRSIERAPTRAAGINYYLDSQAHATLYGASTEAFENKTAELRSHANADGFDGTPQTAKLTDEDGTEIEGVAEIFQPTAGYGMRMMLTDQPSILAPEEAIIRGETPMHLVATQGKSAAVVYGACHRLFESGRQVAKAMCERASCDIRHSLGHNDADGANGLFRKFSAAQDPGCNHVVDNCRTHHSNTGTRKTLSFTPKFVSKTVKLNQSLGLVGNLSAVRSAMRGELKSRVIIHRTGAPTLAAQRYREAFIRSWDAKCPQEARNKTIVDNLFTGDIRKRGRKDPIDHYCPGPPSAGPQTTSA